MSKQLLRIAAIYLIVGAGLGLYMGVAHNFALAPVHAHLLLAGCPWP